MRMSHTCFGAALAGAFVLVAAGNVRAQGLPGGPAHGYTPGQGSATTTKIAPPPALPGTLNSFAPADKTQLDLPPTESLFDAINRGDLPGARDAINRGADLGGHNILGMTPLDLSVDLARNNITFLLLSLRGSGGAAGGPPAPASADAAKSAGAKAAASAAPAKPAPAKPAPKLAAAKPTAVAPQQFAGPGNAGTPNPGAGFLGFGRSVQ